MAWWDPLVIYHLSRVHLPPGRHFVMMDEANLKRNPLGALFRPGNGLIVQTAALGVLVAGGGLVYLATTQLTGAVNYRSLLRSVAQG